MEALRNASCAITHAAPLFPVAVGMIAGVVADEHQRPGVAAYAVVFLVVGGLSLVRRVRALAGPLLIPAASVCVGGLLHFSTMRISAPASVERHIGPSRTIVRLRGTVAGLPRVHPPRPNAFARWMVTETRSVFVLETAGIETTDGYVPVSGRLRVNVHEPVLDLREGERVEVFGWLRRLDPPANPGSFNWAAYWRRRGIVGQMSCPHRENVTLATSPVGSGGGVLSSLRSRVRRMLTDDLPAASDERAGLLDAIVLGHRSRLGRGLNEIFIRAGCAHFVAVSGLHLAIPMSFVWWLGRRLTLSKSRCAWFMLAVVWAYATIAEPRPPILRAAIVATLYCISLILRRPGTGLSWLSVAAVVVVAVRPQSVFGAGFQLSFSAVLGIMFLTPALGEFAGAVRRMTAQLGRRPLEEWQRRLIDSVGRQSDGWPHLLWRLKRTGRRLIVFPLLVSAGAWLASLPIVWVHFQQLHLWSAVGTLVIFPFVYGVVLLGFLKILLALVVPGMAFLAGVPLVVLQGWLVSIAELMGRAPGTTWEVPPMPWRLVPAWYLFLLLFAWRFRRRRRPIGEESDDRTTVSRPASRWATAGPCGALVLLLTLSTGWWWPAAERGRLVATVLSVGAGSVTVLEMPDGKTVLFDAGGSRSYDVGSHVIVPYLRHRGIRSVDRVYLSHPNLDHFSGLPALLDDVDVGPVVVNPCFRPRCPPGSPARHLLDLLGDLNHPVEVLDPAAREWTLGGARWDRLWPPVGLDASFTTNEASTVLRLTYAGRSILLTGDIEERAQRVLLASASVDQEASLRADVLVLPHHGAVEVNTAAFVHAVQPGVVVRSSHERMAETTNGLSAVVGDLPLYNTADVGAVRVVLDGEGVHVEPTRTVAGRLISSAVP